MLIFLLHFRDIKYIVHTILLNILYTMLYCLTLFLYVSKSQIEHDLNICVLHVTRGESQLTRCEFRAVSSLLSFPTTTYTDLFLSFHFSKHRLHPNTTHTRTAYRRSLGLFTTNLFCLKADLSLRSQVLTEDCVSPLETHTIPP